MGFCITIYIYDESEEDESEVSSIDLIVSDEVISFNAELMAKVNMLYIPESVLCAYGMEEKVIDVRTPGEEGEILNIIVNSKNPRYDSRENCNAIVETKSNTIVLGSRNTTIVDSNTGIGEGAFYSCESLEELSIPDSVTSLGREAFEDCVNLKK